MTTAVRSSTDRSTAAGPSACTASASPTHRRSAGPPRRPSPRSNAGITPARTRDSTLPERGTHPARTRDSPCPNAGLALAWRVPHLDRASPPFRQGESRISTGRVRVWRGTPRSGRGPWCLAVLRSPCARGPVRRGHRRRPCAVLAGPGAVAPGAGGRHVRGGRLHHGGRAGRRAGRPGGRRHRDRRPGPAPARRCGDDPPGHRGVPPHPGARAVRHRGPRPRDGRPARRGRGFPGEVGGSGGAGGAAADDRGGGPGAAAPTCSTRCWPPATGRATGSSNGWTTGSCSCGRCSRGAWRPARSPSRCW